jgi:hypothetical protein
MARQHHFGIAAVARGARDRLILAELEIPLAALGAGIAMPPEAAHAYALPHRPDARDRCTQRNDAAHHFMARHARRTQGRIGARDVAGIRSADTAGLDLDEHLVRVRLGRLALHQFQGALARHLHGSISCLHARTP